jgi:putative transport protein
VQVVPGDAFVVQPGDLVSVTSPQLVLEQVERVLGTHVEAKLSDDRSRLDFRRIVVSDRRLTGRRLGDLNLHPRFGAVAARVRQGDVDLLAHDEVTLLPGDRLRIVAPRERMPEITAFLGIPSGESARSTPSASCSGSRSDSHSG